MSESFGADQLNRIIAICERFEAEWREGLSPRIEAYLDGGQPAVRDRLLRELILIEVELRMERGETPEAEEYLSEHPSWGPAIAEAFLRYSLNPDGQNDWVVTPPQSQLLSPNSTEEALFGSPSSAHATVSGAEEATDTVTSAPDEPLPERFGRYPVLKLLGKGGFGRVYLARDEILSRPVAIKVLHPRLFRSAEQVELFESEARVAASLRCPSIVRVYDVGRYGEGEGESFVVFEYVEGRNLSETFKSGHFPAARVAGLMVHIAEAAEYAHQAGLVHRDLKPSNILIDGEGRPHIADLGLALREDLQRLKTGEIAGTPAYMAPEQVRGETHRLAPQTDIWAMGVILYLGLVRRLPFPGRDRAAVFRAVLEREPKPPRQVDPAIPAELERICLKCLSKPMGDRYETAAELADDLRAWLQAEGPPIEAGARPDGSLAHPVTALGMPRIVPRGLRAFDLEDADFFLTLVPGPRDRDGLPESIRGWKRRIEETDPSRSFAVGLLYGPSGAGKSSFVKAGLLPRLASHVRPAYVEASAAGTEARLLDALRRVSPGLPSGCGLVEAAAWIREGSAARSGSKILIVLDQFEQWLQCHPAETDGDLIRALRHCDGPGLQALLLVRDDFWMAITRFLRALEVQPVEGVNCAAVEQFDPQHARRVLAEIGRALGRLPGKSALGEARFLEKAIRELAGTDGRVIPVRLTLLVETLRRREWTSETLRDLVGFAGIGEMFLEQTFSAPSAPPAHRLHERAAQAVLKVLLPDPSSDLKGRLRPASVLREAAGYADRPADFTELIAILNHELRMVTPVDPLAVEVEGDGEPRPELAPGSHRADYYQLTHDYLVPPIRQWLRRKQTGTRRGRAELQLENVTAFWCARPERRRLPSLLEWVRFLVSTGRRTWSADERRMMRAASRHHLSRAAAAVVIGGALGIGAAALRDRQQARDQLKELLDADYGDLKRTPPDLGPYRETIRPELEIREADKNADQGERKIAEILLFRDRPTRARASALHARLEAAQLEELMAISEALAVHRDLAGIENLRGIVANDSAAPGLRLRTACTLNVLDPSFAAGPDAMSALSEALLAEPRETQRHWIVQLGPVASRLVPSLADLCRGWTQPRWLERLGPAGLAVAPPLAACQAPVQDPIVRSAAAEVLAEILKYDGGDLRLARILVRSSQEAARILLRVLVGHERSTEVTEFLRGVLDERIEDPRAEDRKDEWAGRAASAGIALAELGRPDDLWPLLRHSPDPRLRSLLIQRLAGGPPPRFLLDRLEQPGIDPIERQALLFIWAKAERGRIPADEEAAVLDAARKMFADDPHPGVHSAAELLLRQWRDPEFVAGGDAGPPGKPVNTKVLGWERGPAGHTFVILPGPLEFRMGSPDHEESHSEEEALHYRRIDRSLAVATKEVTVRQYREFDPAYVPKSADGDRPDYAAGSVSWLEALRYCNWLSKQAGIDPSQWCYPETTGPRVMIPEVAVERRGFRLPTEAEWEYFCRAGSETARYYGQSPDLLPQYAWTWLNLNYHPKPPGLLLPNEFGIFDALGNVFEWCQDGPARVYPEPKPEYPKGTTKAHPAGDPGRGQVVIVDETWRISRGGSFQKPPGPARSAHRDWAGATQQLAWIGFRVVRTIPAQSPQ